MRFLTEVWEQYSVSQNQAKRNIRRCARAGMETALPTLESVVDRAKCAGAVDLGVLNIPVMQIVGTASGDDNENYTADFLPLPSVNTEFAQMWTQIYMAHLADRGLTDPIHCYEYLGKFYVVDGKKRVSVLKVNGTRTVKAQVTRITPAMTEDPEIQSYYEFVRSFEKTGLYQIRCTQPGKVEEFLNGIGYESDHVWSDADRYGFLFSWHSFGRAMKVAFDDTLNITTADAVQVLLQKHDFFALKKMPTWTLAELMQNAWQDIYRISDPGFRFHNTGARKAS